MALWRHTDYGRPVAEFMHYTHTHTHTYIYIYIYIYIFPLLFKNSHDIETIYHMKLTKYSMTIQQCSNFSRVSYTVQYTAQKIKFSIKGFLSKCEQMQNFLRIFLHLLKESLMENLIFWAVANKCLKETIRPYSFNFFRLSSTNFTWSTLEYFVRDVRASNSPLNLWESS